MTMLKQAKPESPPPPELHSGDCMTQPEFHRIYERMPRNFKAELIGGIVYVASPLKRPHATHHTPLSGVLWTYEGHTPGVETGDNATIVLSEKDEPQPDLYLRILPEYGGQSHNTEDGFVGGAPELLAEIAHSTQALALKGKKDQYARFNVREYIVVSLRDRQVRWFDLHTGEEFQPDAEGILRSRVFPGLWVHAEALLARDYHRLTAVLQQGLASPEHAAFVRALAARVTPVAASAPAPPPQTPPAAGPGGGRSPSAE